MEHIIARLLQDFEQGKMDRRQLIRGMAVAAAAASAVVGVPAAQAASPVKAVGIHHITWDVEHHDKVRDFYADLFGAKVFPEGLLKTQSHVQIGHTYLTFSGPGTRNKPPVKTPVVNHIAIAVEPWPGPNMDDVSGNPALVAELKKRKLPLISARPDVPRTQDKGEVRISDPEGFPVQICGANWATDN